MNSFYYLLMALALLTGLVGEEVLQRQLGEGGSGKTPGVNFINYPKNAWLVNMYTCLFFFNAVIPGIASLGI